MDKIIGLLWNKNEGDLLEEIITDAVNKVDELYLADDGSTDRSWEIMQSCKERFKNITHLQREPNREDPAQRQSLLNKVRKRNKPEDTWVQIIESDVFILDTVVKDAIKEHNIYDLAVSWQMLNGVRLKEEWDSEDKYPNWDKSIKQVLNKCHRMEVLIYTFRPLDKLVYLPRPWRPNPRGFSHYTRGPVKRTRKEKNSPLLFHVGWRGPTHCYMKFKNRFKYHPKYRRWNFSSIDSVKETVSFFNGQWNNPDLLFEPSREGWKSRFK